MYSCNINNYNKDFKNQIYLPLDRPPKDDVTKNQGKIKSRIKNKEIK